MIIIDDVSFNFGDFVIYELLLFIGDLIKVFSDPFLVNGADEISLISICSNLIIFEFLPSIFKVLSSFEGKSLLLISKFSVLTEGIDTDNELFLLVDEWLSHDILPWLFWGLVLLTGRNLLLFDLSLFFIKFSLFGILGLNSL